MSKEKFQRFWEKFGTLCILLLMFVAFAIATPIVKDGKQYFLTQNNMIQVLLQSIVYMLLAFGEFFAILLAGIDLSVGSVACFTGVVIAKLALAGVPSVICVFVGLLGAMAMGTINGLLINALDLHPCVVTLGTNTIYRGISLVITGGNPVFNLPQWVKKMASYIGPIPIPVILAAILAVILVFFTTRTVAGRNLYALGGNKMSAWYSGIDTKKYTLLAHILASLLAGIGGTVMLARVGAAEPTAGDGYETYAIASCIIGGTSFFGGKGRTVGVVLGGITIGTIFNGMNILGVSSFWQKIVMGALIIGSVALEKAVSNTAARS